MKNADMKEKISAKIAEAFEGNDVQKLTDELFEMAKEVATDAVSEQMEEKAEELDRQVKMQRGKRVLTSEERKYFTALAKAITSDNPRQDITNLHDVLPETVIDTVFEELTKEHPLLDAVDFVATRGITKWIKDAHEADEAVWGELCDAITAEIDGALEVVNADAFKLTAFIYVCKAGMEIGPEWLDAYVRAILKDTLANGWEKAIITGTGNKEPIGMDRDLDDETNGTYAQKTAVVITDFGIATIGALVADLTKGGTRKAENLVLIVNPADYYTKVMPAMTYLGADGIYKELNPFGLRVIQSQYVAANTAIIGLAKKYLALTVLDKGGRVEYSDHFKFLDDVRTYTIRAYGNGMPKDNAAFIRLNITNVAPLVTTVNANILNEDFDVNATVVNDELDVNVTNTGLDVTVKNTTADPVNTKEVPAG